MAKGPNSELGTQIEFSGPPKSVAKPESKPDGVGRRKALGALVEQTKGISDRMDLVNLVRQSGRIHRNTGAVSPRAEEPKTEAKPDTRPAARRKYRRIDQPSSNGARHEPIKSEPLTKPGIQEENNGETHSDTNQADNGTSAQTEVADESIDETTAQNEGGATEEEPVEASESETKDVGDQPETQSEEPGTESKLIDAENAGAQAILLTGESAVKSIDRKKLEAIAKGEKPDAKEATKASLRERNEYWNGENSPHKKLSFKEQYALWKKSTQQFLDRYKGKPEAEFFKRMGVDLEDQEAVDKMYQRFAAKGKGDVGLFAAELAKNNTAEQLTENMALIQDWSVMYGVESSKVVTQMAIGIKNAQTDLDSFIKSAEGEIQKGKDMPDMDLVKNLYKNLEINLENKSKTKSAASAIAEGEPEVQPQEFRLIVKKGGGEQKWLGAGELLIDGDSLVYSRESLRPQNPFKQGSQNYGEHEETLASHYSTQEISLGAKDEASSAAAGREIITPTATLWKILETNPDQLAIKFYMRQGIVSPVGTFRGATVDVGRDGVRMRNPFEKKVKNADGTTRKVDVNYSWNKLTLNRETLIKAQQKAIEYLEQQVASGTMPQETLDTAKALVSRYKAPRTVVRPREIPVVSKFRGPERWQSDGSLAVRGKDIVYTDPKSYSGSRRLEIYTADPNNPSRQILTAQAWDVLDAAKRGVYGNQVVSDVSTEDFTKKGGGFSRRATTFTADRAMITRMRDMIRSSITDEISAGRMDEDVIRNVDTFINYKSEISDNDQSEQIAA